MRETFFLKQGFAFTFKFMFTLLFLGIVHESWAVKPFESTGDERDQEEREGRNTKRQKIDFGCHQEEIQAAIKESSAQKLLLLYGSCKETDFSPQRWKEEWVTYVEHTERKNGVLWNTGTLEDYGMNLRGLVFLEVALNEPHMQLLKNVLMPLNGIPDERWDEEYKACVEKLRTLVGRHHYFRRTGGLYGLIASSGFKNPIASLVFLGAFRSVWEDAINPQKYPPRVTLSEQNQEWFEKAHERVRGQLKEQKEVLRTFLSDVDPRYVDLSEEICKRSGYWVDSEREEKEKRAIFDEKGKLGLPYYSILSGNGIGAHLKNKTSVESALGRISCYLEACEQEDPRGGYLYAAEVNSWFDELPADIQKLGLPGRIASIKMGDPTAIADWKHRFWEWDLPREKHGAKNLLKTYAVRYGKMRQYFDRVQGE